METTRINKYLASLGYGSRRDADALVSAGKVRINGVVAKPGDQVKHGDAVAVAGRAEKTKPAPVYIAFNKPVGLITTTDERKKDNVISFLKFPERLFPVGRLDVASSGLLLLTNDGELANQLMHPRYEHEKVYEVDVDQKITDDMIHSLADGIMLMDGMTSPAIVKRLGPTSFAITIREGKNRQIRRMCEALGLEVTRLTRVRQANIVLGDLKPGAWRHLTKEELGPLISGLLARPKA